MIKTTLYFFAGLIVLALLTVRPVQAASVVSGTSVYTYTVWAGNINGSTVLANRTDVSPTSACQDAGVVIGLTYSLWDNYEYGSLGGTCRYVGGGWRSFSATTSPVLSCPSNSTISNSTCVCNSGYQPNAGATACVQSCPANGTTYSSGYYDIGTDPNSNNGVPPLVACVNSCQVLYGGASVGFRQLVAGVYHYYAQGVYQYDSNTCAGGATAATSTALLPAATCGPGQVLGQLTVTGANGYSVNKQSCVNTSTGQAVNPNSAVSSTPSLQQQLTSAQTAASGTGVTVTLAVDASGSGGGNPTAIDMGLAKDDPVADACLKNPSLAICQQTQPSGAVGTAPLSNVYTKGSRTISQSLGDFKTSMQAAPIVSASSGFFYISVASGACQNYSADVPMFGVITFDFFCKSPFTDYLPYIRAMVLIIFTVMAFRIAIL